MSETAHKGLYALLLAGTLIAPAASAATTCEAKTGDTTVALLELYTSEGCSSCPPADRWVADLPQNGFRHDRVVPLAFHVDYWNYLGWVDPFSQSAFTRRQDEFARRTNAATVYTPELVLSGREYRRRWWNSFEREVKHVNQSKPGADITLKLARSGGALQVTGQATKRKNAEAGVPAALYVALYESNLTNKILDGENSGRTLSHAFVVRRLYGPFALEHDSGARFDRKIELDAGWKIGDLGVAAFVQESAGTRVLQSLALDVCS